MLHFLLAALLASVSQAQVEKLYEYTRSDGACRGGQTPQSNAGLKFFRDRDCRARCNGQDTCTGFVLPKSNSAWCETYTSKDATGDGRNFWCYMKGDEMKPKNIPPSAYRETVGACRQGESPGNNAGLKFYSNRGCKELCDKTLECSGFVFPVNKDKNWCETYTSKGASGDGRTPFKCYMKMEADQIQNLCKAENEGGAKHCQCYKAYDATCRAIISGEEDCKKASCQFVDGKCKGKAKGKRIKCKRTKWVSAGGDPMCNCIPGCTVTKKEVKQRVRRRRAKKQPKVNFKCTGKASKFQ